MDAIKRVLAFCLVFQVCLFSSVAQRVRLYPQNDTLFYTKKKPLLAIGEVLVINMGVWAYDCYISKQDFAQINGRTIKQNFRKGFVWDDDVIGTNFISHPYHGSLYFNAARSNGFNFYQSIPFVVGGSLMWEFFLETESPSINDLFATTSGGIMFGEISYRLSDLFIDNSARGVNRVFREIGAGLLSPVRGINRIISGAAWKRSYYNTGSSIPFEFNISAGSRMLKRSFGADYLPYAELMASFVYNPQQEDCERPYDWFSLKIALDAGHDAFFFRQMNVSALLWGKELKSRPGGRWYWGIYHNMDYWDSPVKVYKRTPYRYAQVLAAGPGVNYRSKPEKKVKTCYSMQVNAVGLGASGTDYVWVGERDYSFGSGFSFQTNLGVDFFNSQLRFKIMANNSTLFTWKGYDPSRNLFREQLGALNMQGDKGHVNFTFAEASVGYYSVKNWNIEFVSEFINRYTHYTYYPSRRFSAWSYALRLGYYLRR